MIFADKVKVCKGCGVAKTVNLQNFVPNRPHKVGRPDLPRGVHDTCKECESKKKKASQQARWDHDRAYKQHKMDDDIRRLKGESNK